MYTVIKQKKHEKCNTIFLFHMDFKHCDWRSIGRSILPERSMWYAGSLLKELHVGVATEKPTSTSCSNNADSFQPRESAAFGARGKYCGELQWLGECVRLCVAFLSLGRLATRLSTFIWTNTQPAPIDCGAISSLLCDDKDKHLWTWL